MKTISIFNDVLGPIMRGPSSSHTAAAYRLAAYARSLFGGTPDKAVITFRQGETYARTFRQQAADKAFAAGLLGLDLWSREYEDALKPAQGGGLEIIFDEAALKWADHPNDLEINLSGRGRRIKLRGASTGGGSIIIKAFNDYAVESLADSFDLFNLCPKSEATALDKCLAGRVPAARQPAGEELFTWLKLKERPEDDFINSLPGLTFISHPVSFVIKGPPLFKNSRDLLSCLDKWSLSLPQVGLLYEKNILGLTEPEMFEHINLVLKVMGQSIDQGLSGRELKMKLLEGKAAQINRKSEESGLLFDGLNSKAAVWALAAMEANSSGGLVCAAPTAGSAGILPAVIRAIDAGCQDVTANLAECLMAAGVVGLIYDYQATFAAENGGCQVEVGASAAMAAGAAVQAGGGTAEQVFEAASLMIQNYMGLICDPVKGYVEVPCHIRNAMAASSALTMANLVLGGYRSLIPFDEAAAAALETGRKLPMEFKCTTLGGTAMCPSALAL